MEFRLLGPVELWVDRKVCDFGSAKERHVLAILLMTPGQPVSIETMIDRLWDGNPPGKPRGSIHSYIARLRSRLHGQFAETELRVVSRPGAYALDLDPEHVDLHRFRRLADQARAIADSGDEEEAVRLLRQAEQLWRGEPLSDLSGRWVSGFRTSLKNQHEAVIKKRLSLELDLGRHDDLVGELHDLVTRSPYDESFVSYLMVALYRSGRQREAQEVYHRAWRRISDHLGTPPAQPLRDTHDKILHGDAALAAPPVRGGRALGAPLADNLPRDTPDFTGRDAELQHLYAALDPTPMAITIEAIDGMAGIGKTALATHLARRLAERYPDGRLFLDLQAHDPNRPPIDPGEGLEILLRLIGEPPTCLPATVEQRAALWRTRLSKRRVLLLLDDAAGSDQVRPFLPGAPGCLVLITSRRRLTGLDGVRTLSLDVLGHQDSVRLFRKIVGDGRPLDTDAVRQVVDRCDHLPLAITVVANRFRHRPARSVRDLAVKLSQATDRLAEMRAGDSDVRLMFELSYRDLSTDRRRAFRRLGLYVGPDLTVAAAAALIGCDRAEAESILEELIDFHLVEERHSGRVRFHDLLRDFARDRAAAEEPEGEQLRIVRRLLDHYLHTADHADRMIHPYRRREPIGEAPAEAFDPSDAAEWLRTERVNLLSCVHYAAENGFPVHAIRLSDVLATYLEQSGHWADAARIHEIARRACQETGDSRAAARAGLELSLAECRTGHYATALELAQQAMNAFQALKDRLGMADAYDQLARLHWLSGRHRTAVTNADQALAIFRELEESHGQASSLFFKANALACLGRLSEAIPTFKVSLELARGTEDPVLEGMIINNLGDIEIKRGYHRDALKLFRESLATMRRAGHRQNEAIALHSIADVHRYKGGYDEALHFYRRALPVYRAIADRRNEANVLSSIGITYVNRGQHAEALIHFNKALAIGRELADPKEQGLALYGIGEVHRENGRLAIARESYEQGLTVACSTDDAYLEACCLRGLGDTMFQADDQQAAEELWRRALTLFEELCVSEAGMVRVRLQALSADTSRTEPRCTDQY